MIARRRFLLTTTAALIAAPFTAEAQQAEKPVIGFLSSNALAASRSHRDAFLRGLKEAGYVDGQNVTIEYRWADNRFERLPALAGELVRKPVKLLVSAGGPVTAVIAKGATTTIPIVFTAGSDPVKIGLVASLNRPGGNVTGVTMLANNPSAWRRSWHLFAMRPCSNLSLPHRPESRMVVWS